MIWTQLPERQNRHSSSWWFFLLAPQQEQGFGPKQMMFALATRAGPSISANGVWHSGLELNRQAGGEEEHFSVFTIGWVYDGNCMHEELVHQPGTARLSRRGFIANWRQQEDGRQYGGEIRTSDNSPLAIEATFAGAKGRAHFVAWGDPRYEVTAPAQTLNLNTKVGGAHLIIWPHLRFEGEFISPNGAEQLAGIGYFQRVCLNFPAFPWKWIWVVFADGSIFSCFVPFAGLQVLRRGDWFFPNVLEKATIPLGASGYFSPAGSHERIGFDRVRVTPLISSAGYPHFTVECRAAAGNFLRFGIEPHAHAQLVMERPVLRGLWHSHFNYNEYLFQVQALSGRIGGKTLSQHSLGHGFGNIEYTWGIGL